MTCDFRFPFNGDCLTQLKGEKKGKHGTAKGWQRPLNTGNNCSVCMGENFGLWKLVAQCRYRYTQAPLYLLKNRNVQSRWYCLCSM